MKVLCLYNNECALKLFEWLKKCGHECVLVNSKITAFRCMQESFDLAVSYTYSYIVKQDVIDALNGNIVNIHNSYLPYNRGSDPNMWSLVDNTPRGVTLHYIDEKLDKGFIIDQILLDKPNLELATLKSTYDELDTAAFDLFKRAFQCYERWDEMKKEVLGIGTYHSDKHGEVLRECITSYEMTVSDFLERVNRVVKSDEKNID